MTTKIISYGDYEKITLDQKFPYKESEEKKRLVTCNDDPTNQIITSTGGI